VVHLKVAVSANATSTSGLLAGANLIASKEDSDNYPTERATTPPMAHTPKTTASPEQAPESPPSPIDPIPVTIDPSTSPPADARVETSPIGNALYDSDGATKATKTVKTAKKREGAHLSGLSTSSITTELETTIDDIIKTVERWVHRSEAESFLLT